MPEVRGIPLRVPILTSLTETTVRLALAEDWPAVAGLLLELGRGVAEGTADDPIHHLAFAGHIRQIEHVTLVATDEEGVVLGVIDTEYHQRLGDHRPQARVNDLVVTERAQGSGVGKALLSKAEDLARRRGCFRMALVTAASRRQAIAFYEREGWANYGEWFVKPLVENVTPGGQPTRDDT